MQIGLFLITTKSGPKNNLVSLIFSYDGDGPTTATTNADASFYVR